MKIAICDDDVNAINYLKAKIELQGNRDNVEQFMGASEMTPEKMCDFDLIYLDIEMPGMSGIELGEKIREIDPSIAIVYLTAYDNRFRDAFTKVHPEDYLLKMIFIISVCSITVRRTVIASKPENQALSWLKITFRVILSRTHYLMSSSFRP